ncbi:MAG: DUF4097 domain-containing protein [Gaiellaceae bacterium]
MQTFQTPGPLKLRLRVPAGEVELVTLDGSETSVDIEPLRHDEATEAAVAEARVELRERGGGAGELVVEILEQGVGGRFGFLFGRSPQVRVRISCPHGADLELKSKSADLEARGRYGQVDVETTSGDVACGDVEGAVRIHCVSGDARFGRVQGAAEVNSVSGDVHGEQTIGEATLNSVSGDVRLREAGGSVSVNTVSGDQTLEAVQQGTVTAHSVSGDVSIAIRRGSRVWIDANSRSGDVTSELDVQDARPEGESPTVELRVQTLSGDIAITRALGPPDRGPAETAPAAGELER